MAFSFWRMFYWWAPVEHLAIFNSDSWNILPSPYNDMNFRATSGNMFLWTQGADLPVKRIMINNDVPANLTINGVNNGNAVDANWNTNGYVGIGFNTANQWDLGAQITPVDLVELVRTGTFIKENSDNLYLGLKNEFESNGANRSDCFVWGDVLRDCPIPIVLECIHLRFCKRNGNGGISLCFYYNGRELCVTLAEEWGWEADLLPIIYEQNFGTEFI
ncbi:MAG: hypothetical protein IPL22_11410 [Bacteroidetes bacterium]|nr:hypothetical protein [Bacteroidota bacterium]